MNDGFKLRKYGQRWAHDIGGLLAVFGAMIAILGTLGGVLTGSPAGGALLVGGIMFLLGLVLIKTIGAIEFRQITAVLSRTEAVGGVVLNLLAEGGLRHEVVVPADVADRVVAQLEAPSV